LFFIFGSFSLITGSLSPLIFAFFYHCAWILVDLSNRKHHKQMCKIMGITPKDTE
jgi:hypothetical protein